MALTAHFIFRFIGLGVRRSENKDMKKVNLGFRVGTSSRRVTKYSTPRPGGPRYIVVPCGAKVLVAEDLLHRQLRFREWLPQAKIVNRAETAILELKRQRYDWIFLDRDLLGSYGEDIAEYLSKHYDGQKIVIHSTNPFGAALISKVLRDSGIPAELAPFDVLGVFTDKSGRSE